MADPFLTLNASGRKILKASTDSSTGVPEAGDIVALDATGKLDPTLFPAGFGEDILSIEASEALAAGDFVNIFDDGGTPKIRKADASVIDKEADGFVLAAVSAASNGDVYFEGPNTQLTGLTTGARYYLSTTPGAVTTTAPNVASNVVQYLGRAVSATTIQFESSESIVLNTPAI